MIYIKKGAPPSSVATKIAEIKRDPSWKQIPAMRPTDPDLQKGYGNALRAYFDQLPKDDIREAMLVEQHYLCAYCMRSLPDKRSARIEHWFPLSGARDTAIDYQNFLAVCDGIYSEQYQRCSCCDNSKSGTEIDLDPRKQWMMDLVQYESNGELYFEAPSWMEEDKKNAISNDINNILCLNGADSELTLARRGAYRSSKQMLEKLRKNNKCTVANVMKLIERIEGKEKYPQYAGVMLFCYKTWIKNQQK